MKKATLDDDLGYIFKDSNKTSQITFNKYQNGAMYKHSSIVLDKNVSSSIYTFNIFFSKSMIRYFRRFEKVQELAADVGGFMEILIIIGDMLSALFTDYELRVKLINKLFEFKEETPEKELAKNVIESLKKEGTLNNIPGRSNLFELQDMMVRNESWRKDNQKGDNSNLQLNQTALSNLPLNQLNQSNEDNPNDFSNIQNQGESNNTSHLFDANNMQYDITAKQQEFKSTSCNYYRKFINVKRELDNRKKKGIVNNKLDQTLEVINFQTMKKRKKGTEQMMTNLNNMYEEKLFYSMKLKETRKKEKTSFKFNYCIWLKHLFCTCVEQKHEREKGNIYDFITQYLIDKLDVLSYFKLSNDVERFMLLYFNDCQHYSFDFLKKPNFLDTKELELFNIEFDYKDYGNKDVNTLEQDLDKKDDKVKLKLMKYFINKLKADNFDKADSLLFELIDSNLKEVVLENFIDIDQKQ